MLRSLIIIVALTVSSLTSYCQCTRVGLELALFIGIEVKTPQTPVSPADTTFTNAQSNIKLLSPFADDQALKSEFYLQENWITDAGKKEEIMSIVPVL